VTYNQERLERLREVAAGVCSKLRLSRAPGVVVAVAAEEGLGICSHWPPSVRRSPLVR
jgi:hypothetical protein